METLPGRANVAVLLVLALAALPALAAPAERALVPRPSIATGRIRGAVQDGVAAYLGIPYAAPPVGNLRWRPPAPPMPWEGVLDATQFGPSCPQPPAPWRGRRPDGRGLPASERLDCRAARRTPAR